MGKTRFIFHRYMLFSGASIVQRRQGVVGQWTRQRFGHRSGAGRRSLDDGGIENLEIRRSQEQSGGIATSALITNKEGILNPPRRPFMIDRPTDKAGGVADKA